jgi:hypothetical protein
MTTITTHVASSERRDPFYSSHQCDCWCGTYIPQRNWDLGWRYLRGHKAVGGVRITKPKTFGHRAPRTEPGAAANWGIVEAFLHADLETRRARLAEAKARVEELKRLEQEVLELEIDIEERERALKALLPKKEVEG